MPDSFSSRLVSVGRRSRLYPTVETEVIPRLTLAHHAGEGRSRNGHGAPATPLSDAIVESFARGLLDRDARSLLRFVRRLMTRGVSVEAIYLELLAPAARRLGRFWDDDEWSFSDVTVGMTRLRQLLRDLQPEFLRDARTREDGHRVLLTSAPGEQHNFELMMASDFLRRGGWEVMDGCCGTRDELIALLRVEPFAVIGISASCDARLGEVAALVASVRRASLNRRVGVMVGGPLFDGHPDRVARVGADAGVSEVQLIAEQARRLVEFRAQNRFGEGCAVR